jgi:hypothetical protein
MWSRLSRIDTVLLTGYFSLAFLSGISPYYFSLFLTIFWEFLTATSHCFLCFLTATCH